MTLRIATTLMLLSLATTAMAGTAKGSFTVSMQVLPRVKTGLADGKRPAFVTTAGSTATFCGAEGSTSCAAAAAAAQARSGSSAPVVVTVLTDGVPTAIIER